MSVYVWVGLLCVSVLVACSEGNIEQATDKMSESNQQSLRQVERMDEPAEENTVDSDCPGFEALFALLPDQLSGEEIGEQYFSCDAVTPTASSQFASVDQSNFWTFSVTARDLDSPPARLRWDIANADESQRTFLRKGVKVAIDAETLLLDNCVNNLQLSGLPDWHKTNQISIDQHDVCIGTDAQNVEDGRWAARAKSPQYLYTLIIEGEKAAQFDNAQEATSYIETLFRQFR